MKRVHATPKVENDDDILVIQNQHLLLRYNVKAKWLQQLDISEIIENEPVFPSTLDLKNGSFLFTGGVIG